MKIITIEEHFESPVISQKLAQVPGVPVMPKMSTEMQSYLQRTLPTAEIMQDTTKMRLNFMNQYDINRQVLSYGNASPQNLDPQYAVPLCQEANDELAKVISANPSRFSGFAVLPVGDPKAAATELKRAVNDCHLKGVLLKGNYKGHFFDDPFFRPIFEMASHLDVPVYMHPSFIPSTITQHYFESDQWSDIVTGNLSTTAYGWHMDIGIQIIRMITSGIFDQLPNLKLISGHWGELVPFFLERLAGEIDPISHLKQSFATYYRQNVYVTPSGILTNPQLNFVLSEVGADHLLYATDYPYKQPQNTRSFLDQTDLSSRQLEAFTHGNAEKLLHLS
ncbi:amidohydrolase family protein [Secundilactobacillus folii]|uniref:Amidohydrolase family protein n=1 Tax=Secundilactobacillus folii TaxID=2678357 RepID=A0A7X3C2Q3_9LACO|nr:amidohydrolase family protein [Secundilactobacillus folii]MTV81479.1 amidohydrolase family protein [Secundilactobacillus folii]